MEVFHDGHPHRPGHPEPEGARVADVELHDLVPLALELLGAAGKGATNLVADVVEVFGGAERSQTHGVGFRRNH